MDEAERSACTAFRRRQREPTNVLPVVRTLQQEYDLAKRAVDPDSKGGPKTARPLTEARLTLR